MVGTGNAPPQSGLRVTAAPLMQSPREEPTQKTRPALRVLPCHRPPGYLDAGASWMLLPAPAGRALGGLRGLGSQAELRVLCRAELTRARICACNVVTCSFDAILDRAALHAIAASAFYPLETSKRKCCACGNAIFARRASPREIPLAIARCIRCFCWSACHFIALVLQAL